MICRIIAPYPGGTVTAATARAQCEWSPARAQEPRPRRAVMLHVTEAELAALVAGARARAEWVEAFCSDVRAFCAPPEVTP